MTVTKCTELENKTGLCTFEDCPIFYYLDCYNEVYETCSKNQSISILETKEMQTEVKK
jgi:hypothetical protein